MRNPEIWIGLIILGFLLFGAKRMPDAARGLGRSLRIFKGEMKGLSEDDQYVPQGQAGQPGQYPQAAPQGQLPAGYEQPVYQPQPGYQQPVYQQPQPAYHQPAYQQPVPQPAYQQPVQQPVYQPPAAPAPVAEGQPERPEAQ